MKKLFVISLAFILLLATGCQPPSRKSISELLKESDEVMERAFGENWKEEIEKGKAIELTVAAGAREKIFEFTIAVKNNSGSKIFVCSSDFTLSMPSGLTINPVSSSVHSFEGIELNQGESTQGRIRFESEDINNPGIYHLNFNHHLSRQQFSFRKK